MGTKETNKRLTLREQGHPKIMALPCQGEARWEYQLVDATQMSFAELHHMMNRLRGSGWNIVAVLDSTVSLEAPQPPELHILMRQRTSTAAGDRDFLYAG